jgi:hypothetical protein
MAELDDTIRRPVSLGCSVGCERTDGARTLVDRYINTVQTNYVNTGFPYPWYCAEGGWFIRVNNYMLGERPF